ncbi:uncharacterized protein LOC127844555 [Dreissena polymorpha]|uniref:Uncharacterized protein n=1 Tax=Dreissena polymorpha TaxID=45954 RepID=A0A9D4EDU0_DREPO|nr:uncharacterized protein LOC127844555 [Dreissena polymorpha]KAH3778749.1 hypothetical protein DPMN_180220 [Dreissena polymorpha]
MRPKATLKLFSELTLYDRRGKGKVTSREFGQYIDTTIEKLHMRLDPERHFFYTTSKKSVYKLVGQYNVDGKGEDEPNIKSSSDIRDHEFDNPRRLRVKPKAKEAKMDSSRNAVARGTLGVRWDCARRNESKLLPTYRLGLDMK